jgi:hypothetical protein
MRTTIKLDPDVAAAVEGLRRQERLGVSEVVNDLIRQGLTSRPARPPFSQEPTSMGRPRVPLDDVAGAIALLEGDDVP